MFNGLVIAPVLRSIAVLRQNISFDGISQLLPERLQALYLPFGFSAKGNKFQTRGWVGNNLLQKALSENCRIPQHISFHHNKIKLFLE